MLKCLTYPQIQNSTSNYKLFSTVNKEKKCDDPFPEGDWRDSVQKPGD